MTLGKRKKFWACFLEVECVFTVCPSGYALNTSISYYFVFGPGGPSSFSLTNKQTNEQANNAWSQVSLSSLQCPVQLPPSTRDRSEDSTWSIQCKPKQGSFSISTQSLILQTVKKPFQGNWKLFKKAPYSFPRPPRPDADLSLLLKACQRVWWDPAQNCWDISEYFSTSRRATNSSILKTVQSRAPLPIPFQSCSPLTAYLCIS